MEIQNYSDFVAELLRAGFSTSGGSNDGIYSIIPWSWNESAPYKTPVRWHTGDRETDPWEWRERVLDERDDIAYSKFFFRRGGYITREWYPYFYAVRRGNRSFDEDYEDGRISNYAKRIYSAIEQNGTMPVHLIKQGAGFSKEEKSRFDSALIDLQMKMYITICGRQQKLSAMGLEYGWASTSFCRTEDFFDSDVFDIASELTQTEAEEKISSQLLVLNKDADAKRIGKFIRG